MDLKDKYRQSFLLRPPSKNSTKWIPGWYKARKSDFMKSSPTHTKALNLFYSFFFALDIKCSINRLGSLNQELRRKETFQKYHRAALPQHWRTKYLNVCMCEFWYNVLPPWTVISINEGSRCSYFIALSMLSSLGSTKEPLWFDFSYQYEIKTGFNVFPEWGIPPFSHSHHHVSSAVHLIRCKTSRPKSFNINGALCRTCDRGSVLNSS